MNLQKSTHGNIQLTGQNDFSLTQITLVHCLTGKTLWQSSSNYFYVSSEKDITFQSTAYFANIFIWKIPGSSDSMYSSTYMLENIWYNNLTWSGANSNQIVNIISILISLPRPRTKFILCMWGLTFLFHNHQDCHALLSLVLMHLLLHFVFFTITVITYSFLTIFLIISYRSFVMIIDVVKLYFSILLSFFSRCFFFIIEVITLGFTNVIVF